MYIKVKVTAGAKKESITQERDTVLSVTVQEEAKGNRANARVLELVAKWYEVPVSRVRIINGHHHPHKLISIQETHV